MKNDNTSIKKIRIIGGKWRGKKIPILHNHSKLRPTKDCVKETLFNWLSPFIRGTDCLDCFAGSGALGLEALSRFASHTTFLEIEDDLVRQIKKKLKILGALNAEVIKTDTIDYLSGFCKKYDIVFVDPPFHKGLLDITFNLLKQFNWLSNDAFIYVESEIEKNLSCSPPCWRLYREKITGQVAYRLYHYKALMEY